MDANAQVDALYALNEQLRKMTSHLEHMSVSASRFAHNLDVMADLGQKIVHSHFLMDSLVERYGTGYDKSGGGGSPGIKGPDGLPGEPGKAGKGGRGGQGGDFFYTYWDGLQKKIEEFNKLNPNNKQDPNKIVEDHLQKIASGAGEYLFTYKPSEQRLDAERQKKLNEAAPEVSWYDVSKQIGSGAFYNFKNVDTPYLKYREPAKGSTDPRLQDPKIDDQIKFTSYVLKNSLVPNLDVPKLNAIDKEFSKSKGYQDWKASVVGRSDEDKIRQLLSLYHDPSYPTTPDIKQFLDGLRGFFEKENYISPFDYSTDVNLGVTRATYPSLEDAVSNLNTNNNIPSVEKDYIDSLVEQSLSNSNLANAKLFYDIDPNSIKKLQDVATTNNYGDISSDRQALLETLQKVGMDFSKPNLSPEDLSKIKIETTISDTDITNLFDRMLQSVNIKQENKGTYENILDARQQAKLKGHIEGDYLLSDNEKNDILDRFRKARNEKDEAIYSPETVNKLAETIELATERIEKKKELQQEQAIEKEKQGADESKGKFDRNKEIQSEQEKEQKEKENNILWDRLTNIAKKTVNFGTNLVGAASPDAMELLSGSFKLLAAQVGTTLIPSVVRLSYGLQGAASLFDRLPKAAKDTIGAIGGVGITAAGLLVGGRALGLGALGSAAIAHPVAAGAIAATTALVGAGMYYSNSNYKDTVNGPPAFYLENTLFGKYKPGESSWNPFAWPMMREVNNLNNRVDAARKPIIAGDLFQDENNIPGMAVFNAKLNLEMYRKQEVPLLINKFAGNVQWEHIDKKISTAENEVNNYKERFKTTLAIKEDYSGKNAELTSILESQREWTEKLEKLKAVKQYTLAEQSKDPKAMEKFAEIYFKNPSPEMKKKLKGDEELVGAAPLLMHFMQSTQPGYFSPEDLHKKIQLDAISDSPLAQELRRIAQDQLQKLVNNSEELNERIKNMGLRGLVFP